jgi:hypothetical protein
MITVQGLRRMFRPKKYVVRYPRWMAGKPLLYISCALGSLGDTLFGYSQGITAAFQVQPSFIRAMYGKEVSEDVIRVGEIGVSPYVIGDALTL